MSEKMIEITGETIDDAIEAGLSQLGVERTQVVINVIDEGSLGVLGIGKKDAVVQLSVLAAPEPAAVAVPEKAASADTDTLPPTDAPEDDVQPQSNVSADERGEEIYIPTQEELEEESEAAMIVLDELLAVMGLEGKIGYEILPEDERGRKTAVITLHGDEGLDEVLIGHGGQVLYSFQFILRGMVSQRLERYTSFLVDVNDFRDKRVLDLISIAKEKADKAIELGRPVTLEPMPAHERRIVHMTLREDERIITKSKGDDSKRRVRIIPKDYKPRPRNTGNYNDRRGGGGYRGGGNRGSGGGGYRGGSGGGNRNYNDRNQGGGGGYRGGNQGGGNRNYNDRNQGGGGGYRGGGGDNRNYNDRNQGGGNRNYNDRNQGGGGGYRGGSGGGNRNYNDRNQGGGNRNYNDRNQGQGGGGGYRGGGNRNQGGGNRNYNERNQNDSPPRDYNRRDD